MWRDPVQNVKSKYQFSYYFKCCCKCTKIYSEERGENYCSPISNGNNINKKMRCSVNTLILTVLATKKRKVRVYQSLNKYYLKRNINGYCVNHKVDLSWIHYRIPTCGLPVKLKTGNRLLTKIHCEDDFHLLIQWCEIIPTTLVPLQHDIIVCFGSLGAIYQASLCSCWPIQMYPRFLVATRFRCQIRSCTLQMFAVQLLICYTIYLSIPIVSVALFVTWRNNHTTYILLTYYCTRTYSSVLVYTTSLYHFLNTNTIYMFQPTFLSVISKTCWIPLICGHTHIHIY